MEIGYIKLYRKITNSFVWANPNMLKLWLLCLMKANHKGNKFLFNGQEIQLSSGEFVTGRDAIAKEFNEGATRDQQIVGRTLWRWMKKFEEEQMLSIKSTTKYSVISIKNWHDYQVGDQQVSNNRPSTVHQPSTNKNDKNEKNKDTRKRIYEESSIEFKLANHLYKQILNNNPEHKEPNLQKWANDIRLMIERDNRKPEKIKGMIEWSSKDDFWKSNILSTGSLRKNYDRMNIQAASKMTGQKANSTSSSIEYLDDRGVIDE